LFYGPPGTGKTTTIINLINEYQTRHSRRNKSNVIHLNASDERGIDIVRTQINQFVRSKNLFETGLKFVILDEVDYMTKNAQQALKYLLQTSTFGVRFCLVCNYITKIDESLRHELICMRFNQLPATKIADFVRKIANTEEIDLDDETIECVQRMYDSDIRSMVNFVQLNQNLGRGEWMRSIITPVVLDEIHARFVTLLPPQNAAPADLVKFVYATSVEYNTDVNTILHKYFDHLVRTRAELVVPEFLDAVQTTMHDGLHTNALRTLPHVCIILRDCFANISHKYKIEIT
jgi:replication factor C subunit 3/5